MRGGRVPYGVRGGKKEEEMVHIPLKKHPAPSKRGGEEGKIFQFYMVKSGKDEEGKPSSLPKET